MKKALLTSGAVLGAFSLPTYADVPAEVTTAITDAGADIATIGSALIGIAVIAMTFKWLKASFF